MLVERNLFNADLCQVLPVTLPLLVGLLRPLLKNDDAWTAKLADDLDDDLRFRESLRIARSRARAACRPKRVERQRLTRLRFELIDLDRLAGSDPELLSAG